MRYLTITCAIFGCLIVCSAATADLIGPFQAQAIGTADINEPTITMSNMDVISQDPMMNFDSLDVALTLDAPGSPQGFFGSFSLSGTDGSLFADITSGSIFGLDTMFATAAGEFVIMGGTGLFEGLNGFGTFNTFINTDTGQTQVKIGGMLLPAPGALAVLGLAGLCGPRRRRTMPG